MSCATLYPGLYGGVFCDDDADIIASQAWQITMARAFVPHTPKSVTCLRAVAHTDEDKTTLLLRMTTGKHALLDLFCPFFQSREKVYEYM